MGTTSADHKEKLQGPQSLRPYYDGSSAGLDLNAGGEQEFMLMKRTARGAFEIVSDYENFRLMQEAARSGRLTSNDFSNEPPASMFELKTPPYPAERTQDLLARMDTVRASLVDIAGQMEITEEELKQARQAVSEGRSQLVLPQDPLGREDLLISPFAVLPHLTPDELIANVISPRGCGPNYSDRPRRMVESFRRAMPARTLAYPFTNTAVHYTHGVKDMQHAFEMSRLQSALMPFMFVLTENRPPYQNGSTRRTRTHTGIAAHYSLNLTTDFNKAQRGLSPDILWQAKDAADFRDKMIDTFLHTPMFAYLDHNGRFTPAPAGLRLTPLSMQGLGPENVSQFELSMSQFWWSFKYKFHPKLKGALLHELRNFDSGPAVLKNVSLIMGMIALHDGPRQALIDLLDKKYGLPIMREPMTASRVIKKNLKKALHRGSNNHNAKSDGRHLLCPFGANGHTMMDFLKDDLMPMLEQHYKGTATAEKLDTLRFIAATGMVDSEFWARCFTSEPAQRKGITDLTRDPKTYGNLLKQDKSWAQMHAEGRIPCLSPVPHR